MNNTKEYIGETDKFKDRTDYSKLHTRNREKVLNFYAKHLTDVVI